MPGSLEKASGLTLGPSWMTGVAFRQALGRIRALFSGLGSLLGLVFARFWHRCAEKHLLCETLCRIALPYLVFACASPFVYPSHGGLCAAH